MRIRKSGMGGNRKTGRMLRNRKNGRVEATKRMKVGNDGKS